MGFDLRGLFPLTLSSSKGLFAFIDTPSRGREPESTPAQREKRSRSAARDAAEQSAIEASLLSARRREAEGGSALGLTKVTERRNDLLV
jgi:hypothetical protein